jgi:iron complex outermembrane receptor protein
MVRTYTAGFKTTQLSNTLRVNAEWFYNEYRDKLLAVISANPVNPAQVLQVNENAGGVHTTGVDIDLNWSTPIDGLVINGGIGYLQAVVDSYKASQWNSTGTGLINPQQAQNFRMAFSPRWTAILSPVYTLDLAEAGKLQFAGTANYRDKEYMVSPTNITQGYAQDTISDARVIYNANISWTTKDEQWRVALEGRNLSNERVLADGFNIGSTLFALGGYNEPRTWGASVRYQMK